MRSKKPEKYHTLTPRYEYSVDPNPWAWLESKEAAEEMALQVAFFWLKNLVTKTWDQVAHWKQFGADGIDLDLETGAGDQPVSQMNFEHPHSFFFPAILILSSF